MPIREYRCAQCHTEFEELVSGDATPPCSSCGSSRVEQLLSCCRIHGSGGGFDMGSMGSAGSSSGGGCSGCSGGSCGSCH